MIVTCASWQLTREAAFRWDGCRRRRCGLAGSPFNPLQADHLSYDNYNRTGRTTVNDPQTAAIVIKSPADAAFSASRLNMRGLLQLAVAAIAMWLLVLMLRSAPELPGHGSSGHANTLVIPSKLQLHRHRHHRQLPPDG